MYGLSKEQQDQLIEQRLQNYSMKRYEFYLDLVAFRANGETALEEDRLVKIAGLDKAAAAIEALRGGEANADA